MRLSDRLFTARFTALWIFQFATFFGVFQLLPVIPLRILDLGGSKAAAGAFLTVYTFASAFSAPITGAIADHVGRRRVLVIASLLFIIFSILYGVIAWLPAVLLIGLAHGAIWSAILSASGAVMTEFIPPSRRTEGMAYWGLAPTFAIAIAPAVGMYVHRIGWLALCIELALISTITSMWASRLPGTEPRQAEKRVVPRLRELWDWSVVKATLSLAVVAFGYGGVTSYVAIYSMERGIHPPSIFFTVFAIATVIVRVFASRFGDRVGHKVLLYPGFIAMPAGLAVLAITETRWQIVVAATLFGLGMGAAFPAFMNFIVSRTDERRRGRTFGSVIGAFDTGIGVGSFAIGMLGQRLGLPAAFGIAAALSCLSIPIFVAATRGFGGTAVAGTAEHAGTG